MMLLCLPCSLSKPSGRSMGDAQRYLARIQKTIVKLGAGEGQPGVWSDGWRCRCYRSKLNSGWNFLTHNLWQKCEMYSNRMTSENKRIHTPSSFSPPLKVGVLHIFYNFYVAWTAAQHCMEGMSVKHQRAPLGQSVSINFVTDGRLIFNFLCLLALIIHV